MVTAGLDVCSLVLQLSVLKCTLYAGMYLLPWQCKKAVDVGRANRAGFADIGKAYSRMAKASSKMGDKEQAIAYLEDAQVMYIFQCILLTAGFNVCRVVLVGTCLK